MTKFITFWPGKVSFKEGDSTIWKSAVAQLNDWLAHNPDVEVVSWQAVPVGTTNELYMVVQYEEN